MNLADLFIAKKLAGGGGGGTGTDNYNDLSNKPQINSTALTGDKSASDLGLQSEIDSDNKISADYVDDTSASNKFVSAAEKLAWSGKQDAIDADHKIDADYVDDTTSDNKFVTASDKTAWNAKQNAIDSSHKLSSDLVDDTGHTNLFVTSTEKSTWTGKQDKIDSSHKLSSTLVSFDSSEAAALASGIDSTKVSQIATNQTNILSVREALSEVIDKGSKNLLPFDLASLKSSNSDKTWNDNICQVNGVDITVGADGSLTFNGTSSASFEFYIKRRLADGYTLPDGTYMFNNNLTDQTNNWSIRINRTVSGSGVIYGTDTGNGLLFTVTDALATTGIWIVCDTSGVQFNNLTIKPMICTKAEWEISQNYVPYALPNSSLTAGLIDAIDNGAKNMFEFGEFASSSGGSITMGADSVTVAGTQAYAKGYRSFKTAKSTNCTLHYRITSSTASHLTITIGDVYGGTGTYYYSKSFASPATGVFSADITLPSNTNLYYTIVINNTASALSTSESVTITDIMICPESEYAVTPAYTPYALPNYDLTRLEAEDRASLAEVVDSGAKNLYDVSAFSGYATSELTMSEPSNGAITVTGTVSGTFIGVDLTTVTLAAGTYVLAGCPSGGGSSTYMLQINSPSYVEDVGNGAVFTLTSPTSITVRIRISKTTSSITKIFKPMICTKAAFGVSNKFVPYRPNYDLVAQTVAHDVVFKKKSETITTANAWQVYSSLAVTLPVGKTIDITAAAEWSHNSPATDIAIIKGTTVTGTQIIATNTAPSGGQLSLCAHGMYYNSANTDATINVAVKYPSTENNQVSIAYRIF